jgi:hypothetical protein
MTLFGMLTYSLPEVTALYDQFFGDSGRLHRSLRCHRLHVGKRGVSALLQGQLDAFQEQIMDFASLVEGDLPQRLISGLWQIDAPAPPTKRLSRRDY